MKGTMRGTGNIRGIGICIGIGIGTCFIVIGVG